MVKNFNELVLQQARIEDRIDRIGRQKAKQILDEKRERQVGLSRTGELFEPITSRLDEAHKYRKEMDNPETERNKEKKREKDEARQLVLDAMADNFKKEDLKDLIKTMGEHNLKANEELMKGFAKAMDVSMAKEWEEIMKESEGAVGVDPAFPEEYKFPPTSSPVAVPPSQQPMTSTPAPSKFDFGSFLQTQPQPIPPFVPQQTIPSPPPIPSSPPPDYTTEAEEVVAEEEPESAKEEIDSGRPTEEGGDEGPSATDESESQPKELSDEAKKKIKSIKDLLYSKQARDAVDKGQTPTASGQIGRIPKKDVELALKTFERLNKGGEISLNEVFKSLGWEPVYSVPKTPGGKAKLKHWERKKQGKGLDDSLTESERLKAFAIIKRNIGSINAGNTSKQSVQETINAIQLLFLSQEITNQQRINLLQKLKSAIR